MPILFFEVGNYKLKKKKKSVPISAPGHSKMMDRWRRKEEEKNVGFVK